MNTKLTFILLLSPKPHPYPLLYRRGRYEQKKTKEKRPSDAPWLDAEQKVVAGVGSPGSHRDPDDHESELGAAQVAATPGEEHDAESQQPEAAGFGGVGIDLRKAASEIENVWA